MVKKSSQSQDVSMVGSKTRETISAVETSAPDALRGIFDVSDLEVREQVKKQYEKASGTGRGTGINISWEIGESWDLAIKLERQRIKAEVVRVFKEIEEGCDYPCVKLTWQELQELKSRLGIK